MLKKRPQKKRQTSSFTVLFEPLLEGGYNVIVPAIPEICTFGRTLPEAKRMANDALACYLESLVLDRKRIPLDIRRAPQIERMNVDVQMV